MINENKCCVDEEVGTFFRLCLLRKALGENCPTSGFLVEIFQFKFKEIIRRELHSY